jgi:AraC-like DNA-binding protein
MQIGNNLVGPPVLTPFKCVSTQGIRLSDRRAFWEDGARALFGAVQVEMHRRAAFGASVEYKSVADMTFCRLSANVAHRAIRSQAVARNDSRTFIKAVLQREGSSVMEQNGLRVTLRTGEWTIYDAQRPYRVEVPDQCALSILLVPRDKVVPRGFDIDKLVMRRFTGRRGLGKLIWSLITTTFEQIPEIQDRSRGEVGDILAQMIRLAILDPLNEDPTVNSKEALRERVKQYISNHLGDPELSIAKLASVTHCTKRYLHMVFESERVSLSDYILERRLDRCRQDFLDPGCAHKSITDIAYSWGFNNSNHFSRCFKRVFGTSPRRFRSESAGWNPISAGRDMASASGS